MLSVCCDSSAQIEYIFSSDLISYFNFEIKIRVFILCLLQAATKELFIFHT